MGCPCGWGLWKIGTSSKWPTSTTASLIWCVTSRETVTRMNIFQRFFFRSICQRVWDLNQEPSLRKTEEVFMEKNMLLDAVSWHFWHFYTTRFGARLGIHFQSVETQVKSMVQSMLENGFNNAKQYAPGSMWITVQNAADGTWGSRWSRIPCIVRSDHCEKIMVFDLKYQDGFRFGGHDSAKEHP